MHPHVLRAAVICTISASVAFGQTRETTDSEALAPESAASSPDQPPDLQDSALAIEQRTNEFREEQGLSPVSRNEKLLETAKDFAQYMARTDNYGHHADDRTPAERVAAHGYEYCLVAENIAYQYNSQGFTTGELTEGFVEGWKNSPEHRDNMLEPAAMETAVAIARSDETGNYYAVQLFARPRSAQIAFSIANRSGEDVTYQVGERSFTLPPRYTRTHQQCRQETLTFSRGADDADMDQSFTVASGATYVVTESAEIQIQDSASAPEAE
jgi:uncharacterized protein YkwD